MCEICFVEESEVGREGQREAEQERLREKEWRQVGAKRKERQKRVMEESSRRDDTEEGADSSLETKDKRQKRKGGERKLRGENEYNIRLERGERRLRGREIIKRKK